MELRPIRENWAITTISDQLFRKLSHLRIQIVPNVVHDAFGTFGFCCIRRIWIGLEAVLGLEPVHVNMAVLIKLIVELFAKLLMVIFWEVPERVGDSLTLLFLGKERVSFGSVRYIYWSVQFPFKGEVSGGNRLGEVSFDNLGNLVYLLDGHVNVIFDQKCNSNTGPLY